MAAKTTKMESGLSSLFNNSLLKKAFSKNSQKNFKEQLPSLTTPILTYFPTNVKSSQYWLLLILYFNFLSIISKQVSERWRSWSNRCHLANFFTICFRSICACASFCSCHTLITNTLVSRCLNRRRNRRAW